MGSALLDDPGIRTYVKHQVNYLKSNFLEEFGVSTIKLGKIQVLTGSDTSNGSFEQDNECKELPPSQFR